MPSISSKTPKRVSGGAKVPPKTLIVEYHIFEISDDLNHTLEEVNAVIVGYDYENVDGVSKEHVHVFCKYLDGIFYPMSNEDVKLAEEYAIMEEKYMSGEF